MFKICLVGFCVHIAVIATRVTSSITSLSAPSFHEWLMDHLISETTHSLLAWGTQRRPLSTPIIPSGQDPLAPGLGGLWSDLSPIEIPWVETASSGGQASHSGLDCITFWTQLGPGRLLPTSFRPRPVATQKARIHLRRYTPRQDTRDSYRWLCVFKQCHTAELVNLLYVEYPLSFQQIQQIYMGELRPGHRVCIPVWSVRPVFPSGASHHKTRIETTSSTKATVQL